MSELAEQLNNLSPQERREQLARLIQRKAQKPKLAPLSFTQERLWFLEQLNSGDNLGNMPTAVRLAGQIDVAALRKSLNEVVRRHDALRTTFSIVEGRPMQVIVPFLILPLPVHDLLHLPEHEREAKARRLAALESQKPFDLTQGPLLRVSLLRLSDRDHVMLLNIHHTISDGWSQSVLLRELVGVYQAIINNKPSPLPELPVQYADFAAWQRQALQAGELSEDLAYWKQQLADPLPALELITGHLRSTAQNPKMLRKKYALSQSLTEELKALSRRQGITLFTTLLAAINALLYRYTGQDDIVIGIPIANRNRTEVEGIIGPFINTLVLRTELSGHLTFLELLDRVRQVVLGAFAHKDIPFEKLVEELQPERDMNRNPLFQIVFAFQDMPAVAFELPGLKLSPFPFEWEINSRDALGFVMQETKDGLVAILECRADLLNLNALEQLETLLRGIVTNPEQRIADLPLLTETEQYRLLMTWNDTQSSYPEQHIFPQIFEAQADHVPDAVAAVYGDACLTYEQLNRRANHLTAILIEHGVGPDVVVALLAERSLDFLTAMLAVFKAGGAYLPLDPRYPASRVQLVLARSKSPVILAAEELMSILSDALPDLLVAEQPRVLHLSQLLSQEYPADNLPVRCTPHHLAYVIYTSGSTGVPKGAMVEQRGMINHLYAKINDLELTEKDIIAQTASQSFDISVWQFLACLAIGGRVHIFPDEIAHDPVRLLDQISEQQITILETVPSLLRAIMEQMEQGATPFDLTPLRWLIPTGEALPPELSRRWLSHYPELPLMNAYGPTECSDDVTHYPIHQPPAAETARTPIGSPIANTQIYILDADLQPVPVGVAGELCVGGDGVGRGYLYEPLKTAQTFIPDPFSPEPGARLYRTGDLACYNPNGHIEFLGRIGHQVKVRGFRIELGDIEAILSQHPAVRETVVLAREDTPGDKRLVAYIVPHPAQALQPADLRDLARQQLPDYMVPSTLVLLDAMPLTPNGKVNRQALPAPDTSRVEFIEEEYVAPESLVEKKLAEIWAEILEVERVGVYDNFFDLGGHSLLATQVIYKINQELQMNLSLRNLFEEPTVAGLAILIEDILLEELQE